MKSSRQLICVSLIVMTVSLLTACSIFQVHQPDVQQGNAIEMRLVKKLKPGMTQNQVVSILGDAVLTNAFRPNLVNYVYTLKVQERPTVTKRLTLTFRHGILQKYTLSDEPQHPTKK